MPTVLLSTTNYYPNLQLVLLAPLVLHPYSSARIPDSVRMSRYRISPEMGHFGTDWGNRFRYVDSTNRSCEI
jgi:hypothetical protein